MSSYAQSIFIYGYDSMRFYKKDDITLDPDC